MPRVVFQGSSYALGDQSVLDCLTAQGHLVPSACRSGVCQTCLMRLISGSVPPRAQAGLTPTMVERGLFLACQCQPTEDIEVAMADTAVARFEATVVRIEDLAEDVRGLYLRPHRPYPYRAGQFLRLFKDAQNSRNYSLASVPQLDEELQLHVRAYTGGLVSGWVFKRLRVGERVQISEPFGDCFYVPGDPAQNMLLIGTGCGLAPLYGIVRDALRAAHRGQVRLYHGSRHLSGLYLTEELQHLAAGHANFSFRQCVPDELNADGEPAGSALERAIRDNPDLTGWRVFLCGSAPMVEAARLETFLAGAASAQIHADPFVPNGTQTPVAEPA